MTSGPAGYPTYRDSGVAWLGDIPVDWRLSRAKYLFRKISRAVREEDETITCFRDGTVTLRRNRRLEGFTEAIQESGYQGIRTGDLVIHQMDAFAGAIGVSDSDGKGSPVYAVCSPVADADPYYYQWVARTMAWSGWIAALARGVRERSTDFRFQTFGAQVLPLPPLEDQRAIAEYCEDASSTLQSLIASKERLIALSHEQSRALVDAAVVGGPDPEGPTKESIFGDVPAHWELRKLWTVARLRRERNPGDLELLSVFLDRGVIPYSEGGGQVHAPSLDLSKYQVVRPGDLVLNNQQAWRGSVGVADRSGIISPAYLVVELSADFDPRYAGYLMRSAHMVGQYVISSRGVGDIQRQLYWPHLRNVIVPVPPIDEQREIVARIERATRGESGLIAESKSEIGLLRELRTQLIADAVTGKMDVRRSEAATGVGAREALEHA